ncbi:hypothetical protein SVIOM342S_07576 [Streptomyces violaceorubidus]
MAKTSLRFRSKEKSLRDSRSLLNSASRFLVEASTSHRTGNRV